MTFLAEAGAPMDQRPAVPALPWETTVMTPLAASASADTAVG